MKSQDPVLRHRRVETRKLFQPQWFLTQTFLFNKVIYNGENKPPVSFLLSWGLLLGRLTSFQTKINSFLSQSPVLDHQIPNIITHAQQSSQILNRTEFIPTLANLNFLTESAFHLSWNMLNFVVKSEMHCS